MKHFALLASMLLFTAATGATDILVLSTGELMDVKSYEVREHVVVIEAWDGRLRALPHAYVDLEATEQANDYAKPEQEIAPDRLAKAKQVCSDYGVRNSVAIYSKVLDSEIQKLRGHTTIQTYDTMRSAFRNAFDGERSFDAVVARFAENANLDLLGAWSEWLESPLAKRMVGLENDELDEQDSIEATRYYIDLKSNTAAFDERIAILNRLDEARRSTESGTQVVLHLIEVFYEAAKTIFPDEDFDFDAEELRRELAPVVKDANVEGLLVLFRTASAEELEQYIDYWRSRDGQRVVALMNAALEEAARHGSEVAMQMVAGKRYTVP